MCVRMYLGMCPQVCSRVYWREGMCNGELEGRRKGGLVTSYHSIKSTNRILLDDRRT